MYDIKALYEAENVSHAIQLLAEHPQAQIIAGGSDVLVQIREGKRAGAELVSIYGLDDLRGICLEEDGMLRIGSLTSFSHITKDPLIQKYIPVLGEAVDMVGGPQIRNIGTIGGNTCNGVTSADSASTLFAWDAVIELTGLEGIRRIPIQEFYIRAGKVDLRPAEIQTGILLRRESYEGYAGKYIKYAMRNAMDIATLGCSVNVKLTDDKERLEDVRIAYGVAGPIPLRAHHAEQIGRGKEVTKKTIDRTIETISEAVLEDVTPRDSWRASKAFREHISKVLCKRALKEAIVRAGGVGGEQV
ncbi:xanthine dehydrogenase subunit XdhB [Mediterraneibacter massiliensis]|uniref:xanthine dehydrogenase subunit XdhB n=1 Tax=Mediterraneibacter massiliensis TaxID=1720300 RepID=UPI0022E05E46|nr:xanthine dehydrogenase subunit XdhB [Mediterraneibacter massiliensis]